MVMVYMADYGVDSLSPAFLPSVIAALVLVPIIQATLFQHSLRLAFTEFLKVRPPRPHTSTCLLST